MASPVEIANLALSWLGQDQINAFGDNQKEAIVMDANYILTRDKVLADRAWTFATERQILPKLATGPAFGGGNSFLIPTTVLRVHRVFRPDLSSQLTSPNKFQNADWTREGRLIISDEVTLWCLFIVKVEDSTLFSPSFVHALAARMAADTCMTLTENKNLKQQMEDLYVEKLADAAYSDGSQGRTEIIRSSRLTGTRKR